MLVKKIIFQSVFQLVGVHGNKVRIQDNLNVEHVQKKVELFLCT